MFTLRNAIRQLVWFTLISSMPLFSQDNVIFDQFCCVDEAQFGCGTVDTAFDFECSDADDFNVARTTTVRRLEIQGAYEGELNDSNHSGVTVRIWSDMAIMPDSVVHESTFPQAVSIDGNGTFDLNVNISLDPGDYWLQVVVDATGIAGSWAPTFSRVSDNYRSTRAFRGSETFGAWFVNNDTNGLLFRLSGESTGEPPPPSRLIAHITAPGGGFDSRLIVTNQENTQQSYTLLGYASDGTQLGTFTDSLTAGRTRFYEIEDMFGNAAVSHIFIDDAAMVFSSVEYRAAFDGSGPAHVNQTDQSATRWRLFPGNTAVTWDGFAAVNLGDGPTNVRVTQRVQDGGEDTTNTVITDLPRLGKGLAVISNLFTENDSAFFEISADQPIALTVLRGSQTSDFLWENRPVDFSNQARAASHVTAAGGGFFTKVLLSNDSASDQTVLLEAADIAGNNLGAVQQAVPASSTTFFNILDLFGTDTVSHFDIAEGDAVGVTLAYQAAKAGSGPAHVGANSQTARVWRIYPGNPNVTWDGFAIVNRGNNPTDITVTQRDTGGFRVNDIQAITNLQPNAKGLFVITGAITFGVNTYFEISASENTAITALRGNLDSDFLWENVAIPAE